MFPQFRSARGSLTNDNAGGTEGHQRSAVEMLIRKVRMSVCSFCFIVCSGDFLHSQGTIMVKRT